MRNTASAALFAAACLAATAPAQAEEPLAAGVDWSGFYLGANIGGLGASGQFGATAPDVLFPGFVTTGLPAIAPIVLVPSRLGTIPAATTNGIGISGGGQVGYNWQTGRFVFGIEGDVGAANVRSTATVNVVDPFAIQTLTGRYTAQVDWTASLRLRAGVSVNRMLIYATGGPAFAGGRIASSFTLTNPIPGIFFPIPFEGTTSTSSAFTTNGWTIGGGVDWAINDNWSLGGEYRFTAFGRRSVTLANTDPAGPGSLGIVPQKTSMRLMTNQVMIRLNYRFGG
jgi:outer membrane immunogenic protein